MVLWSVNLALEVGEDCVVGLAGEVALKTPDGFSFEQSLACRLARYAWVRGQCRRWLMLIR